jgi:rRNA biogenesis protein RRP5
MAAPKRKAETGATTPKKEAGASDRSAKRQRKSDVGTNATKPAKSPVTKSQTAAPKPAPKSVFNDGEKAFPRGGASVLTPLEHKQIQIKATQDVLFEQAGGVKRSGKDALSDAGSDGEEEQAGKASKKRKSKKVKKTHEEEKENVIRVEGLSYKVSTEIAVR